MDTPMLMAVLGWGALVGIVFSAIGAAGGILTSFGLITLFAVADPNAVKPMTQIVVLATALVYVPGYLRRGAIVPALGLLLGLGGVVGAWVGQHGLVALPRRHGHVPAAVRRCSPSRSPPRSAGSSGAMSGRAGRARQRRCSPTTAGSPTRCCKHYCMCFHLWRASATGCR